MTLRLRLLTLVGGIALFAATGVTSVALWRQVVLVHRELTCEGTAVAGSVASAASRFFLADGPQESTADAIKPLMERAVTMTPLLRGWVVDRAGNVVLCVDRTGTGCPAGSPSAFRPPEAPLDALWHLVRRDPLESSAPIINGGELRGAVRISYRADGVVTAAHHLATGASTVAAIFIALGLLLGTVLVRRVTRPITALAHAAEALPDQLEIKVGPTTDPELNELVAAFNRMSGRLKEGREQMQKLIASLNERVAAATEEGLRAERLATLGGIAAGFAHEMGNSLHVIAGFNAVVLRELPKDHPNRADLEAVKRESARAAAMLERFLFFARARAARPATQSIEPMVREAVEVIGPAAAENNVVTDFTADPELPQVYVDAELLRQAFVNLCVNAVQAMGPDGGQLHVRARKQNGGIAVEFEDTGPGVPEGARERIFDPFFTTKATGTGLGLAIVRQAAEASGGKVEVDDAAVHGALFRIVLPAARVEGST